MTHMYRVRAIPVAAMLLLALNGCASSPERPYQDIARAEAGINQAEQSGAQRYAAVELGNAKEKLARARAAVESDEMIAAERYAEEAALIADLAAAKVRSHKADLAVQEVEESIAVLRQEIRRNVEEIERNRMRQGETE